MDFSGLFDTIKEKFSEIKDAVLDWIDENRKMAFITAGLILVILLCLLLLVAASSSAKKKKAKKVEPESLVINEGLLIPNGPELPRDYTLSRQTKEKWSDEELSPWFTTPTEKEINSLSQSNKNMINEIIKAAP